MPLHQLTQSYLPAIEEELRQVAALTNQPQLGELHTMICYHLGWQGENAGPEASGKRVRPVLTLLTTEAAGGPWRRALPPAAAIELVHNFSLIHDDIEDNSDLRRGRPTVWKRWGVAQAINTGDTLFSLAHLALFQMKKTSSPAVTLEAATILQNTCLHLTQGQHLDIAYENRTDLTLDDYWPMVRGKTGALLAACTELGALIAGVSEQIRNTYRDFGLQLGLAFQALDDLLGIWGASSQTGKSSASDLIEAKKSLPVLYGLEQKGDFAARWAEGPIQVDEAPTVAQQLEREGARAYAQKEAARLTEKALQALKKANPQGQAGKALFELTHQLLHRKA